MHNVQEYRKAADKVLSELAAWTVPGGLRGECLLQAM